MQFNKKIVGVALLGIPLVFCTAALMGWLSWQVPLTAVITSVAVIVLGVVDIRKRRHPSWMVLKARLGIIFVMLPFGLCCAVAKHPFLTLTVMIAFLGAALNGWASWETSIAVILLGLSLTVVGCVGLRREGIQP